MGTRGGVVDHNQGWTVELGTYIMHFQTEGLEYMITGFIPENENRMGAQTRGWESGIGTNYRETE